VSIFLRGRHHGWRAAPAVFAIVALLLPSLGLSAYWQREVVQIVIFYLLASSLDLVLGYAGELALGQVAIMASGAYVTAILFNHGQQDLAVAVTVAIAVGLVLSLATGIPSVRLSSWTLGLVSFFLVLILPGVVTIFKSQTGGLEGIGGLFNPKFLGVHLTSSRSYYLTALGLAVLWTVVMRNLIRSPFGLALQNMREGPLLSTSLGVSTLRLRLSAYLLSSIPAAVAGCLYAYLSGFVSPEGFGLDVVVAIIAAGVVGGLGTTYGAMIGAALLVLGPLRASSFKEYSLIVYGGFLVFVAVVFPAGVAGAVMRVRTALTRRRPELAPAAVVADKPVLVIPGAPLHVSGVSKAFGGVQALKHVDMVAEPGSVTALIGPNGAGKTTLLNTISGFTPIDAGVIAVGDRSISDLRAEEVARAGIGRTFQTPMIPRGMQVVEIIESGRLCHGRLGLMGTVLRLPRFRSTRRSDRRSAEDALAFCGLSRVAYAEAQSLPLGTRRLLEVVRAVVAEPHVVLLDEPAAGLDDEALEELRSLIGLLRDAGATVVLVEHNVPFVLNVADVVYVLDFGTMIANGPPNEVRRDPKVIESYLGSPRNTMGQEAELSSPGADG